MSDNPLDNLPTHNRLSIRAVLVHEGEDASAALSEAGFATVVTVPVMLGEQLDLSGGILGNGITPNLVAVLETEEGEEAFEPSPYTQPGSARPYQDEAPPSEPVTTMLPAAFGTQPLAPVRKIAG
jgi:hypothetical protein